QGGRFAYRRGCLFAMSAKTLLGALRLRLSLGCGSQGPNGQSGDAGPPGLSSTCDGGAGLLNGRLTVSAPANGPFFVAGEKPVITIQLYDNCGKPISASSLGTANLYLSGPRGTLQTQTTTRLLNCVVDRSA